MSFLDKLRDKTSPLVHNCPTLGLYGIPDKDALDLVEKKIQRALRARAEQVLLLFEESPRLTRVLESYLSHSNAVENFTVESGRILITLHG